MTRHRVVVICNALDDATRIERGITTDSPAASRKVLQLCAALRQAGLTPVVLGPKEGLVVRGLFERIRPRNPSSRISRRVVHRAIRPEPVGWQACP